ncbi:MAG TPA: hypothetical protein VGG45_16285 [Terracidiphilus sp.]
MATDIAITHTPFEGRPSISEQDRRRQTPVFKLYILLLAEQQRTRNAEAFMEKYKRELIASNVEKTRLTRELAGSNAGLQNRTNKGSIPSPVSNIVLKDAGRLDPAFSEFAISKSIEKPDAAS